MLTKLQYRTVIQQYLDDPGAQQWSSTNLDILTQLVLDDLWTDMLDMCPYLTSQRDTIAALHSPGYIDLRLTATGDLSQRLYRVQSVKNATQSFNIKDPREVFLGAGDTTVVSANGYTYDIKGDQLWLYASNTSFATGSIDIRYSYKPAVYSGLADGTSVTFPEGAELAPILLTAASAMAKGNEEDNIQLTRMALDAKQRLMSQIRRKYHGMIVPFTTEDWPIG